MEGVILLWPDAARKQAIADVLGGPGGPDNSGKPSGLVRLLPQLLWKLLRFVPGVTIGDDLFVDELADGSAESPVRIVVIRRIEVLVPARVAVGYEFSEGVDIIRRSRGGGGGGRRGGGRRSCNIANVELRSVFLQSRGSVMEFLEFLCCVLPSLLEKYVLSSWVVTEEIGDIIDLSADDNPAVLVCLVFGYFFESICFWHSVFFERKKKEEKER